MHTAKLQKGVNGKTTTTMPFLCSDPDSVHGETSGPGFSIQFKSVTMVTCLSSKFPYRNTVVSLVLLYSYAGI